MVITVILIKSFKNQNEGTMYRIMYNKLLPV